MLNELYELSKALEHHGLLQATTNPNVRNVGKGLCLLIEVDRTGHPQATRLLYAQETAQLWKHSKGNHNNFPAIRVQKPLLAIEESVKIDMVAWKKAKITEKVKLLEKLNFDSLNSDGSDIKISEWSLNELAPVLESQDAKLAALKQLISVFPRTEQSLVFTAELSGYLRGKIAVCDSVEELDCIKELLVGSWDNKSRKYTAGCMTYYDVHETANFDSVTASSETRQTLVALLNNQDNAFIAEAAENCVSPFTGSHTVGVGDKYPNPNLPVIGQTYLYSKKSDTPCLTRYSLNGAEAFQAGKDEVRAIHDAIAFLTAEERKNKSWKVISDSNRENPNLLLAYVTDNPHNDALLAQILGDPSDYETEMEYRESAEEVFDALCRQVLDELETLSQKNPHSRINLVVLEALDPGRKQIVYENVWSFERFQKNLLSWMEAAKNHPDIKIRVRNKKIVDQYVPLCPGPNEICQLLKVHYTRSGSAKPTKQSALSLQDIYRLYMPQHEASAQDHDFFSKCLQVITEKSFRMLADIKHLMMVDYALPATKEWQIKAKRAALLISLISIVLWRLNVRKENYMHEASYNIGQFLQLSDMLHKLYCVQVRNGGDEKKALPTQLMGNEMLAIASEFPVEGLNRLRERMKVYQAWANTATGEGAGLAKWILARYGEVSAKLAASELPEQFTPVQQAQVLLGYLAAIPYEKKNNVEDEKNE
ncbi:hypothetical protein N0M98_29285 [Paenibacillus doosanensis]|uniref:hypothetical protein n=1 Tax=Paenibacillus doosanensis TaxID=1229154 RepID=UPI00217FEFE2|nr:hypothetical protein [Paenibacillus doosanensis]MCS7464201.1 hypothetical protein [Paenibacillus doosanensis]